MKMKKVINEYLEYSKLELKNSTYDEKVRKINKYIIPYFENKNIEDINYTDIIKWKIEIEKYNFKYNYKSYLYYCLTTLFDYCVKYYDMKKNYAKLEGNFKNNDIESKGNIWTIEEFNNFIKVIEDKKDRIMFKLLFLTGMRKGELLALTWNDIDFENNTININKTITRKHEIQSPKTKTSNRKISITNQLSSELNEIKNNDELIFNISFTTLKRKKDYYCNKSNVKKIKIHEFRHSHACYLFKNNIEIEDISFRLGHQNISITMNTYLKYLPKNEKKVIKLLSSISC